MSPSPATQVPFLLALGGLVLGLGRGGQVCDLSAGENGSASEPKTDANSRGYQGVWFGL